MNQTVKTLGAEELATLLNRHVTTVRADVHRRPESLPPRLAIPGTRKLLWLESDVMEWLKSCRVTRHKTK